MIIPRRLTTLISINIPVLKRTTNKSTQLSGRIPQPIEVPLSFNPINIKASNKKEVIIPLAVTKKLLLIE